MRPGAGPIVKLICVDTSELDRKVRLTNQYVPVTGSDGLLKPSAWWYVPRSLSIGSGTKGPLLADQYA